MESVKFSIRPRAEFESNNIFFDIVAINVFIFLQ